MGPNSKEAITKALGHIIDELLQQRSVGKQTLDAVRELTKRMGHQEDDHHALAERVAQFPRRANGNGNGS